MENLISADELYKAVENDKTINRFKTAAEFFITTINDWPTYNLTEPADFLKELQAEINLPLSFEVLEHYDKMLDFKDNNAWKKEALSSLLLMLSHFDKSKTVEEVIFEISEFYKNGLSGRQG